MEKQAQPSAAKGFRVATKNTGHINKLPNWVIGISLRKLSVIDRLHCEGVDRRWRDTMRKYGWTEQKELSEEIIFEGALEDTNRDAFTNGSLFALFKRVKGNLLALDISSFTVADFYRTSRITPGICPSLSLLTNLSKIDMMWINLTETVPFLPPTLYEIRTNGPYNKKTLTALAAKCPNLEVINFESNSRSVSVATINNFLIKYPSLKKLSVDCDFKEESGSLTSIGELKELEEFEMSSFFCFDEEAFLTMLEGCKCLRRLEIYVEFPASEESLCNLAKLSNLVELFFPGNYYNFDEVTDVNDFIVSKAISKCQKLQKLDIKCCRITDDSVVCLLANCKSLVSLNVYGCSQVTEASLKALIAEVNKRHGNPPKSLPVGPSDVGIFHFCCEETAIGRENALSLTTDNPWLELEFTETNPELDEADEEEEERDLGIEEVGEEELSGAEG